jgi:hypothetical protein
VEPVLPVRRHAALGPRDRLVDRVVLGRYQRRSRIELVRLVIPKPVFVRLEAPDDEVARGVRVLGGVLARGTVAAAYAAAFGAPAQVEPPATVFQALGATGAARWHRRVYPGICHQASLVPLQLTLAPVVDHRSGAITTTFDIDKRGQGLRKRHYDSPVAGNASEMEKC